MSRSAKRTSTFERLENRRLLSAAIDLRAIVSSGMPAPDLAGITFLSVFEPTINDRGEVSFSGKLAGPGVNFFNDLAVWSSTGSALGLVARTGSAAPGAGGSNYIQFGAQPQINDDGTVQFVGQLTGAGIHSGNDTALFAGRAGNVLMLFQEGQQVPGTSGDVRYGELIFNVPPEFSDSSHLAIATHLQGDDVHSLNGQVILWGQGPQPAIAARKSFPAPGTDVDFNIIDLPSVNDDGWVAFQSFLYGPDGLPSSDEGIWVGKGNDLRLAVRQDDAIPGLEPGSVFVRFDRPSINSAGQIAFASTAFTPDPGGARRVFVGHPGVEPGQVEFYQSIARNLTTPPGVTDPDVVFNLFRNVALSAGGHVLIDATLSGPFPILTSGNDEGIWLFSPQTQQLELAFREGDPLPSVGAGVKLFRFDGQAMVNALGQTVVSVLMDGPGVNIDNDRSILVRDADGTVRLVAREGESIEVAPGVTKTFSSFSLIGGNGGEDGRRSAFNDAGQIAFRAFFTDGPSSTGIIVADTLPLPSTAPTVSASFEVDRPQPTILLDFDHSVAMNFSPADLVLTHLGSGQMIIPQIVPVGPTHVELRLPRNLADGDWRLTLLADGISDASGNHLEADQALNFFFLAGDANRDRRVNLDDFNILAANFGQSNRTFSQGDFNYDGDVGLDDFNILASRFGSTVLAPNASPFGGFGDDGTRSDRSLEELLA